MSDDTPNAARLSRDGRFLNCRFCGIPLARVDRHDGPAAPCAVVTALDGWKRADSGIWRPNNRTGKRVRNDVRIAARYLDPSDAADARRRLAVGRSGRFHHGYGSEVTGASGGVIHDARGFGAAAQRAVIWTDCQVINLRTVRAGHHPKLSAPQRVECANCGAVCTVGASVIH
jgi:hypothetical protein